MTFPRPDASYWNDKLAAYLHDPPDKAFSIRGHEERSARLLSVLGLQRPNEAFWKKADGIASGFERGQVPSYSSDPDRNGAVDFAENPVITHPTARDGRLRIDLPFGEGESAADIVARQVESFLEREIGMKPGDGGYSGKPVFANDEDAFAFARFLYIHHGMRFKLAESDVGGIGGLWHRLPADTRFPDHTIWQHNALTSALYSCMAMAGDMRQVGILAFSITPVQPFIAKARKLRDYWTGSVILSWLAFEGLRWVMEHLGPDHLLYPSLVDQPLVNEYLRKTWEMDDIASLSREKKIASLPNKFLCLVPLEQAREITGSIEAHIRENWSELCRKVFLEVCERTAIRGDHLGDMFTRQTERYWDLRSTVVKLLEKTDIPEARGLLHDGAMNAATGMVDVFSSLVRENWHTEMDARGLLYANTHQLVQTALAAGKSLNAVTRSEEPGRKCRLCGEFEALHDSPYTGAEAASTYKTGLERFWNALTDAWQAEADLDGKEQLCALCLTKRIAYRILKEDKTHILNGCFDDAEGFPSTTEMAMYGEFRRRGITTREERRKLAQRIYDNEAEDAVDTPDRYYAILVMDGDHMGRLINGETIGAAWATSMHPEMRRRLESPSFDARYRKAWAPLLARNEKRLITPSIHAAISEALGDFSIHGAARIVKRHHGRLIYAGGDDVCAVLPVSTAVRAAREISEFYTSGFNLIDAGEVCSAADPWAPEPGKLAIGLGANGDRISISAGILICHHKAGLSQMIARAHALLENHAKEGAGRAACAVELSKRSGGSRFFTRKWKDPAWESFQNLGRWISAGERQQVSRSLAYRLNLFRDGVNAMLQRDDGRGMLVRLLEAQLERSGIRPVGAEKRVVAEGIVDIVLAPGDDGRPIFRPEGLIVAAFAADTESEVS
ncbi:type III-B CRISPR-associated protein Cas10/Cmr2 [Desulfococcus multivorans]|uniref:CRISPR-associated protein, Crm2 family n=1 Tax=Desulfococcus multivorans DSM 2059 TaxID=1121405 RepID=S7T9U7_DESML|nr:type III-B CRISPR-associated protein Cas10/Cmr2 [Desulfococcus multivorans]AOY59357.1 Cas2: CRISPR-associated protein Cas2 [Desulfococcus multivorans]AQV01572.1 type III-B CRISPR-associated protein Cas10/Cmr2 [Desulfococcus multivorans]EPR33310.1 CRISPR-associated protein, Crm2 family [Desulfococcus multivorans DSM 2059]SKA13943.1 CRISPR-associated protein Cmr2 [Desulfococcus multivorans DSM 2059]